MAKKPQHAVAIYRASIRISLNGDTSSALRDKLKRKAFVPNHFINDPGAHGTGSWINVNCSVSEMKECISSLWAVAAKHEGPGSLDHVWSNFELIDLRSFVKDLKKTNRMTPELKSFLEEQGMMRKGKK